MAAAWAAACLTLSAALWAHALASPPDEVSHRDCVALESPSKLDYLVLASMAASPRPLALAGYRSSATVRDAAAPLDQAMVDSIAVQFQRIVEARF
ncbi:MAG: hypothetical protein NVS9B2_25220 [Steroidobacteraceae bacterium]